MPLLGVQGGRYFDQQLGVEVAALAAVDVDDAFPTQLKTLATLRSRGHFQRRFAPERRRRERDRDFAKEIVVFPLEDGVFLYMDNNVEVALLASANARFPVAGRA